MKLLFTWKKFRPVSDTNWFGPYFLVCLTPNMATSVLPFLDTHLLSEMIEAGLESWRDY